MANVDSMNATIPAGLRALVVEDSRATRRIFRNLLKTFDVEVADVSDGQEAYEFLSANIAEIDIVFSDISMPRMDGFELCYRLHCAEWYDGTPLVMVSTQSDAANVIKALKLGAADYLPKPFDREVLACIMGRVVSHV